MRMGKRARERLGRRLLWAVVAAHIAAVWAVHFGRNELIALWPLIAAPLAFLIPLAHVQFHRYQDAQAKREESMKICRGIIGSLAHCWGRLTDYQRDALSWYLDVGNRAIEVEPIRPRMLVAPPTNEQIGELLRDGHHQLAELVEGYANRINSTLEAINAFCDYRIKEMDPARLRLAEQLGVDWVHPWDVVAAWGPTSPVSVARDLFERVLAHTLPLCNERLEARKALIAAFEEAYDEDLGDAWFEKPLYFFGEDPANLPGYPHYHSAPEKQDAWATVLRGNESMGAAGQPTQ